MNDSSIQPALDRSGAASQHRAALVCLTFVVVAVLGVGWIHYHGASYVTDEWHHVRQIEIYLSGGKHMHPGLPQLPGYHVVMAGLAKVTGMQSLESLRLLSMLISVPFVYLAYFIGSELTPWRRCMRALQCFFLPMLLPFSMWVYTDPFSLCTILAALFATERRRYLPAALFAGASVAVRQNNIIWVALFHFLAYVQIHGLRFDIHRLLASVRPLWGFVGVQLLFLAFVLVNGGFAVGDRRAHPTFAFHSGNVFVTMVILLAYFFPLLIACFGELRRRLAARPALLLLPVAASVTFWFTFSATNPYNQPSGMLNDQLALIGSSMPVRAAYLVPIVLASFLLIAVPFRAPALLSAYPASLLFLSASWLITSRYAIVPLVLFTLFRRPAAWWSEWMILGILVLLSALFFTHGLFV